MTLDGLVGRSVTAAFRVVYVLRGDVTSFGGPLVFLFSDGSAVTFDAGADGEVLDVRTQEWEDPFAEPLSVQNREYVERSGKWTAIDVRAKEGYRRLIGQRIRGVSEIRTPRGTISGVVLEIADSAVRVEVEADELEVNVS